MARFNLRKFTDVDWLRSISPSRVVGFFHLWRDYLAGRGFVLPGRDAPDIDYAGLANALMTPGVSMPAAMIEALYYVRETSDPEDMEELQAKALSIIDDPTASSADYAIDVWLADHELLRDHHAGAPCGSTGSPAAEFRVFCGPPWWMQTLSERERKHPAED